MKENNSIEIRRKVSGKYEKKTTQSDRLNEKIVRNKW